MKKYSLSLCFLIALLAAEAQSFDFSLSLLGTNPTSGNYEVALIGKPNFTETNGNSADIGAVVSMSDNIFLLPNGFVNDCTTSGPPLFITTCDYPIEKEEWTANFLTDPTASSPGRFVYQLLRTETGEATFLDAVSGDPIILAVFEIYNTVSGLPTSGDITLVDNSDAILSGTPNASFFNIRYDVATGGVTTDLYNVHDPGADTVSFASSTTYTYNNGWSPSDPNGVSTSSDDINVIVGNATISSNTDCDNITISAGAGITINSGVTLTTVSGIILESTSTSYSSLILDGTLTGAATYRRHVNQTGVSGGNDLIASPVSGETFDNLLASNSNIVSNGDNSLYLFGPFDKTTGSYLTYASTETAALTSGVGYRSATTNNSTLSFSGGISSSNVSVVATNSGPSFSEWNLIGNPYPSYLNVQDFLNNATNAALLDETNVGIYGYDGDASDGWVIYNLNTTDANTIIAPGQGFFVATDTNGSIAFTPSMRRHGDSDDFIAGRNTNINYHLKLELNTTSDHAFTDFYFNGNSTTSLDPGYDAAVFGNTTNSDLALYSHLVANGQGMDFAIQSLPLDFLSNGMVPLGLHGNLGQQLGISIDTTNLPDTIEVYLMDTVENTSTLLNTTVYVFTPSETLNRTGRFYIGFSDTTLSTDDTTGLGKLGVRFVKGKDRIDIVGQLRDQAKAELYDVNGRLMTSTILDRSKFINALSTNELSRGIYLLNISNSMQSQSFKVIVN